MDVYNKQRDLWFEEMVTSTLALERHEAGRINNIKSLLSRYSTLLQETYTKGIEVNMYEHFLCLLLTNILGHNILISWLKNSFRQLVTLLLLNDKH